MGSNLIKRTDAVRFIRRKIQCAADAAGQDRLNAADQFAGFDACG